MKRWTTVGITAAALLLGFIVGPTVGPAQAATTCPPSPPPGSTIYGNLEVVSGTCILKNVTVTGSITIDNGGHLELDSSTVYGNVTTAGGGEFDSGSITNFNGHSNGQPSVVRGSVLLTNPADFDFRGGSIGGNVVVNGFAINGVFEWPLCGVSIGGNVTFQNLPSTIRPIVGDPDADNNIAGACPGNTINGSVTFSNVAGGATLEATQAQSATFNNAPNSHIEQNTLRGNLTCSGTTTVAEGAGTNSVGGTNTCG